MYWFRLVLVSLLLAGSNLPESLCGKHSSLWQFDNVGEDAKLWSSGTTSDENDGHFLLPIDLFEMTQDGQKSEYFEQTVDAIIRPPSFKKKIGRSNSSRGRTSSSPSGLGNSMPRFRKSSNSASLLECMYKVVTLSLPPVVLGQDPDPFQNFLGIIGDFSGEVTAAHLVAVVISHDRVEFFLDAATSCFELFEQDSDGKLVLDADLATSAAAESIKLHPMGALAVGATEAIAENVRVTYNQKNKPLYIVKYTGLFTGLGVAAVKTTKIGQIATKSTEGRNWLSKSVRETIKGNSFAGGHNHTPIKQVALMECVLNAVTGSLAVPATHDQGFSVLQLFVKASRPCFGLYRRNGNGKLSLAKDFAAEVITLHPMGKLAVGAVNAIMVSVIATGTDDSGIEYHINHTTLGTELGNVIVESTEIDQKTTTPAVDRRRKKNVVSRFIWGPDASFSDRMPAGLVKTVKLARECVVGYWESAWYTRGMSDLVRGVGPHKRIPVNLSQLLGCVAKAIGSSLYGAVFKARSKKDPQPGEDPGKVVSSSVLESFIGKVTPCFGFFKRNEHGRLELDPAFIRGVVAEALRLFPVGSVIAGTIESIAKNVKEKRTDNGKIKYKINYAGLAIGLGMTAIGVTTFGIGGYAANFVLSFF